MKDKFKIVVIGDLFLDILPSPLPIEKEAILKDGETFIDKITFQRGGCAGNFCAVLSSLIPESDIIFKTKVGNDKNGDFLEDQLKKYGIITDISRPEGISKGTAITIAISYGDGERHFITYNGVMDDFNVDEIDCDRLFEGGDHLAWRGIWFTPQLLKDSDVFLSEAKNKGLSVSMDLGFDPYWSKEATPENIEYIKVRKERALKSLKYVDYLFGNEEELCQLTSRNDIKSAIERVYDYGVKHVIVHRGGKGARIYKNIEEFTEIKAFKVENVINPVGTGDTYDAAFIYKKLSGYSDKDAGIFASAAASFSLSNNAGTPIDVRSVEEFMEKNRV